MIPVAKGFPAFIRPVGNNATGRILIGFAILSMAGLLVGVESFLPTSPSPSPSAATTRTTNHYHHRDLPMDRHHCGHHAQVQAQRQHHRHPSSRMILENSSEDDDNGEGPDTGTGGVLLESIGLVSHPVVWISLYVLATTGHGLPAGPGGSIGALEGIAYLVVVALSILPASWTDDTEVDGDDQDDSGGDSRSGSLLPISARTLSRITIGLGLLVLAGVATGKGCVPNAKPILDYSAYLPICNAEWQ